MRIKKWMTLVVAFAMAFTVIGFGLATDDVSAAAKAPTKITLKSTYTTVDIKGKVTVSVKSVTPSDASKSVTWKSSNTKIATVNSKGVVTGKKAGKVTITATSKENPKRTAKITITVKQLKPGKVTLPSSVTVYTGVSKTVKASVPSNIYNAGVVYKCSTKLATISPSGKATTGSITIKNKTPKYTSAYFTLTAYSKENPKAKDTCKVKVYRSISALSFKDSEVEIAAGDKATQTADIKVVSPKSYCKTVTYKSHDESIATVDEKTGEVTAVKAGTAPATIEAKAKYGYPAKATYKVTVYDVLEHDNGVYNIGKDAGYSKYKISGVRNGATESVVLSNEDIANIVGEGNLDMDWMDSASVANKFKDIEFNYTSGGDYGFKKEGNAVTIYAPEFSNGITRYYAANSMKLDGNDYTLTLFTKSDGTGSSISIVKKGDTVSVSANGYTFEMTRVGKDTTVKLTSGSRTAEATFTWVKTNSYRITMNPGNISSHNVVVKAYK